MDRNTLQKLVELPEFGSLSARRAWIEIACAGRQLDGVKRSLSARRAWIEIKNAMEINGSHGVALRKESVDRNTNKDSASAIILSRSPQGERG